MSTTIGVLPRVSAEQLQSIGGNELLIMMVARGAAGVFAYAALTATAPIAIHRVHISKSLTGTMDAIDVRLGNNLIIPVGNATSTFKITEKYGDMSGGQASVSINVGSATAAQLNAITSADEIMSPATLDQNYILDFKSPIIMVPSVAVPNPTLSFARQSAADLIIRVLVECTQFVSTQQGAPFPL